MRKQLGPPPVDPADATTREYVDLGDRDDFVVISQEEYDALPSPRPADVLYVIV